MGHTTNRWRARRVHGCAVMSLGMLLIAPFVSADDPGSQPDDRDRSQPLFQSYTVSIASCAAAACHGADSDLAAPWATAANVWFKRDPHVQAYTRLYDGPARRLVERLDPRAAADGSRYEQVLEERCVTCHATAALPKDQRAIGVECQSCHGPAAGWLEPHTRAPWQDLSGEARAATGFQELSDLSVRASTCLGCHVGEHEAVGEPAVRRDVDHDLIAAGHPPLHFEFATYLKRLPPHWDPANDRAHYGDLASWQAWRVGRVAHAASRLRLLADRAAAADVVWPELSEYGCYECHHSLQYPSWRQAGGSANSWVWETWFRSHLADALEATDGSAKALADVARVAEMVGQPWQKRNEIAVLADSAAEQFRSLADALAKHPEQDRNELRKAKERLITNGPDAPHWDAAWQWVAALRHAGQALDDQQLLQVCQQIEQEVLPFAPMTIDHVTGKRALSPARFEPQRLDRWRAELQRTVVESQR